MTTATELRAKIAAYEALLSEALAAASMERNTPGAERALDEAEVYNELIHEAEIELSQLQQD